MPDRGEIYEMYWLFRKENALQFDILFKPEAFAAWLNVSGKKGAFGDEIGAARLLYRELVEQFDLDQGKLKERLAQFERLLVS